MKGFLTAAERLGSFEEIRRNLAEGVTPMLATGLSQIHKVHFAWALTGGSRLVLTPDEPAAVRMAEDLNRFYGEEKAVVFPTREFSFREVEGVSREYEFARLRVLESLAWGEEMVVVASAEAALQRTIPPETLRQHCTTLTAGQTVSPEEVIARLLAAAMSAGIRWTASVSSPSGAASSTSTRPTCPIPSVWNSGAMRSTALPYSRPIPSAGRTTASAV